MQCFLPLNASNLPNAAAPSRTGSSSPKRGIETTACSNYVFHRFELSDLFRRSGCPLRGIHSRSSSQHPFAIFPPYFVNTSAGCCRLENVRTPAGISSNQLAQSLCVPHRHALLPSCTLLSLKFCTLRLPFLAEYSREELLQLPYESSARSSTHQTTREAGYFHPPSSVPRRLRESARCVVLQKDLPCVPVTSMTRRRYLGI